MIQCFTSPLLILHVGGKHQLICWTRVGPEDSDDEDGGAGTSGEPSAQTKATAVELCLDSALYPLLCRRRQRLCPWVWAANAANSVPEAQQAERAEAS